MRVNKVRRLAQQTRNDGYLSKRDYQNITYEKSLRFRLKDNIFSFSTKIISSENTGVIGFGGFLNPSYSGKLKLSISYYLDRPVANRTKEYDIIQNWNRIGLCLCVPEYTEGWLQIKLEFNLQDTIDIWGFTAAPLNIPEKIKQTINNYNELNANHLSPETFYLQHTKNFEFTILHADGIDSTSHGRSIALKKCSFCQRMLPVREDQPGALSFHKHNAKISNHQNECRACKKWRINDEFNPIRTTDQLHESSLITREKKILLREPEILTRIKERTGQSLKTKIWLKFNKKCFFCKKEVTLSEYQLDHTRPLAYLWPLDEYATCLCAEHNNHKKDKFPVDFYSPAQLIELSEITGLQYEKLCKKEVNKVELQRIINDIVNFATTVDPRTFSSIYRRVLELHPDINLFEILKNKSPETYQLIVAKLEDRSL
ncbi:hypothetical protein D4L89_RS07115 [Escherichia coli]|nr:hypothetical protein [Escherichia coli]